MDSRKMIFTIEYVEINFDEVGDDKWGWIKGNSYTEYFEDEGKFNQRISELEALYDYYEITSLYSGEVNRIIR
jgi:hypothetical protein